MGTFSPSKLISLDMHCLETSLLQAEYWVCVRSIYCWNGGHLCVFWGLCGIPPQSCSLLYGDGRREERKESLGQELVMPGPVVVLSPMAHHLSLKKSSPLLSLICPLWVCIFDSDWPLQPLSLLSGISLQHDCGFLQMQDLIQVVWGEKKEVLGAGLLKSHRD